MDARPFFSVVIPLYNRKHLLKEVVASVLSQTFSNFEVIIVDDGSTDSPETVVGAINDSRVKYIKQSNKGGGAARNVGINAAQGDYIAFLDSDDKFLPHKLNTVWELLADTRADVIFSYTIVDRGNGVTGIKPSRPLRPGEAVDEYLFCSRQPIQTSTLVVQAELAKRIRFKDDLKKGQDLDFALRLYRSGAVFNFIEQPLSVWTDQAAAGRVSHTKYASELESWLAESRDLICTKAYYGYRANVLSYELAKDYPFRAFTDIVKGFLCGGVSLKRTLHSLSRAFFPKEFYRTLVNKFLKIKSSFS